MIPQFPDFKPIELSDKEEVEKITKQFPPYSDFNFVSMWSWDVKNEMQVSLLNDNLVVRFTDYLTGDPFLSFLGNNIVDKTTSELLEYSNKHGLKPELKLVPEDSILTIDKDIYAVIEDRDHFDYILSLELLSTYENSKLRGHASFYRRFVESYGQIVTSRVMDLNNKEDRNHISTLTNVWAQNKISQNKDLLPHLSDAVNRFFTQEILSDHFVALGVFMEGKLVAYIINELEEGDYSTCHFMKGDNSYKGIYSYMVQESSKVLLAMGKKYTNFEQDLGLVNLRQSKKTYHPVNFLKKHIVVVK